MAICTACAYITQSYVTQPGSDLATPSSCLEAHDGVLPQIKTERIKGSQGDRLVSVNSNRLFPWSTFIVKPFSLDTSYNLRDLRSCRSPDINPTNGFLPGESNLCATEYAFSILRCLQVTSFRSHHPQAHLGHRRLPPPTPQCPWPVRQRARVVRPNVAVVPMTVNYMCTLPCAWRQWDVLNSQVAGPPGCCLEQNHSWEASPHCHHAFLSIVLNLLSEEMSYFYPF